MKKLFGIVILLIALGQSITSVHGQTIKTHESKHSNQAMEFFILSLFEENIKDAVSNYYNDKVGTPDSINYVYEFWNENYDVVEVLQSEPERKLETPYIVKFTILPQKRGKGKLGIDTITFGVEPRNPKQKKLRIKMLNYKHIAPKKVS